MFALVETMIIGLKSLSFSASAYAEEDGEELTVKEVVLTMVVAFGFGRWPIHRVAGLLDPVGTK